MSSFTDERLRIAIDLSKEATTKDIAGDYAGALEGYKAALDVWQVVAKHQQNPVLREKLYLKMDDYVTRAEVLRDFLAKENTAPQPTLGLDTTTADHESTRLRQVLEQSVVMEKPNVRWDDVAGLESAKEILQEAVVLPRRFPELFKGALRPWGGVLLYGPPGTGKTFLAKAVASEADATFLQVSSADLVSKWQGESERLVRQLFVLAEERSPTVIFIDEVDSLCCTRNENDSESSRRIKTEFLVQMTKLIDGNSGKAAPPGPATNGEHIDTSPQSTRNRRPLILILAATNMPWDLDSAFRRRFEKRVYIPLPDYHARYQILKNSLKNVDHELTDWDFRDLSSQTDGYSGYDLAVVVREAQLEPIRRCKAATHFRRVSIPSNEDSSKLQTFYTPCGPGMERFTSFAEKRELYSIPPNELMPPKLTKDNMEAALKKTCPTVSADDLSQYTAWTSQFGSNGK